MAIFFNKTKTERKDHGTYKTSVKHVWVQCDACKIEKWMLSRDTRKYLKKYGKNQYYCYKCYQNPFKEPKPCIKCGVIIPWNPKQSRCDECLKWYKKKYYRNKISNARQRNKERAFEMLGGKCKECSYVGPSYHFDYHHVSGVKEKAMSKMWCRTWSIVKQELDKCELLCAFCHRDIHKSNY